MNTHDRSELPPLPPHPPVAHMGGRHAQADCQFPVLYAWAKAYARAAIEANRQHIIEQFLNENELYVTNAAGREAAIALAIKADRKRRGEPVAWEKAFDDAKKVAHLYNSGTGILGHMQQQYAHHARNAPQPAEPVKLTQCGLCHNMRTLDPSERPAEPVKVLSDDDVAELSLEFTRMEPLSDFDYVGFARALLARYGNPHVAQPAQPAASAEPVEYQSRIRPGWLKDKPDNWTEWERCTAEQAADYERTPLLHDWHHQVRRLYAAPVAAQPSAPVPVLEAAMALLVAGGFVTEEKVNEAIEIAKGAPTPPAGGQTQQDDPTSEEEEAWQQMEARG